MEMGETLLGCIRETGGVCIMGNRMGRGVYRKKTHTNVYFHGGISY